MRTHLILACLTALALPAGAETFQPREGCTHVVTIQGKGCHLRNVVTCPDMGEGLLVYTTGADGQVAATVFDQDGAMLFNGPEGALTALQDKTDLFSLAALRSAGTDTCDYTMAGRDGAEMRFVGMSSMTGETVEIDGRSLKVVLMQQLVILPDGSPVNREMTACYDEGLNLVIAGEGRDLATGNVAFDRTPVDFLFPGEDGALATTPLVGCAG
jgi:hypothetical protein